jgi:uncharacterized protein (UPF0276 family)
VCDPVWALYQQTLEHFGPISTLLERDDHFRRSKNCSPS